MLFPFGEFWWVYLLCIAISFVVLAVDLGVIRKSSHEISFKEATIWTITWAVLAALFGIFLYYLAQSTAAGRPDLAINAHQIGKQAALEYFAGYIVEYALSMDNIFVFILIFNFFAIRSEHQHRVLFFGILGALIFRGIFIALGSVLMAYEWVVIGFGILLIVTGIKTTFSSAEPSVDPSKNPLVKLLSRYIPLSPVFYGQKFFLKENGKWLATPLLPCLLVIEMSDIVFAVDSVPAIFGLTKEPLIVFTSNLFAILGLRSLYFLLAGAYRKFHLLKFGLGVVLTFVGLKMVVLNHVFEGGQFPIGWSLGIIAGILGATIGLSLLIPPKGKPAAS